MCKDCGCEDGLRAAFKGVLKNHQHTIEMNVLHHNDEIAHTNRHYFEDRGMRVFNLMSSPGSGKTLLLEKTLQEIKKIKGETFPMSIIVGDQQTDRDARRLEKNTYLGCHIKQINTPSSCHLDASMIARELDGFIRGDEKIVIIENVGNLVCPAAFDLGEAFRVALLSITEGEDKPIKYPVLFHQADIIIITKIDLLPHVEWKKEECYSYLKDVNPHAPILELSAKTGEGIKPWIDYLLGNK